MPGAVLVETPGGMLQIGAPFDAFKRMLILTREKKLPIPYSLIAPEHSTAFEMALWAPEFYVLHHLFLLGSAFKHITTPQKVQLFTQGDRIDLTRKSLEESIIGPGAEEMRRWRRDGRRVLHTRDIDLLSAWSQWMAVKRDDGAVAAVEDFVDIIPICRQCAFEVFPGVRVISLGDDKYRIEAGCDTQTVDISVTERVPPLFPMAQPEHPLSRDTLGAVVLGNRSGFSTIGPNTGFLLWVNGHPVVFDGPYGTVRNLAALGVHSSEIKAMIVSHVHEDHIGALVELVLLPHRPLLLTAEPIYRCILSKLALYLDQPIEDVARYLNYQQVHPGHPRRLYGADFNFFYTAHPIPTLGVKVSVTTREEETATLVISGDTYNCKGLAEMQRIGVIGRNTQRRLMELVPPTLNPNSLFFVDAGQAFIHGDDKDWRDNPNHIVFYHVDAVSPEAPPQHELSQLGRQYTLVPPQSLQPLLYERLGEALHFNKLKDLSWIASLMNQGVARYFKAGSVLVKDGRIQVSDRDRFYVIVTGSAQLSLQGAASALLATLGPGEFFGDIMLSSSQGEAVTLTTTSPMEVFEIPAKLFSDFIEANDLLSQFRSLWKNRQLIERASLFRRLDVGTRNLLSSTSIERRATRGQTIFPGRGIPDAFYYINKGSVDFTWKDGRRLALTAEDEDPFFGVFSTLDARTLRSARVVAASDEVRIVEVPAERIRRLYEDAPLFRYQVSLAVNRKDKPAS